MSIARPILKSARQADFPASAGQTVFGPCDFVVYDPGDIKVLIKTVGGKRFLPLTEGVSVSVSPAETGYPTVTLQVGRAVGEIVRVKSARIHDRQSDVTRGGALQSSWLEAELDKQATVIQELTRDATDALLAAERSLEISDDLLAGAVPDDSVTTNRIVDDAITAAKIAPAAVLSEHIKKGEIQANLGVNYLPTPFNYGFALDKTIAENTAALRLFFGPLGPPHGWLPGATVYQVNGYLRVTGWNRRFYGTRSAVIQMVPAATEVAGKQHIQPVMIADANSKGCLFSGFTLDHAGDEFTVYPQSEFLPGLFGAASGDGVGVAVLLMGDDIRFADMQVQRGWDNGISIGRFDEVTGVQSNAPLNVTVAHTTTFTCGIGRHSWDFQNGQQDGSGNTFYRQGCGIDNLTGLNSVIVGCHDYGSRHGFWDDISGGGNSKFIGCVAHGTSVDAIASDAAAGGNQPWNQGGFGGTITGTGAGWLKTPGGIAFYSGSRGTEFIGCLANGPAMYGFVADYASRNVVHIGCQVINAGMAAFLYAGKDHQCVNAIINGAWKAAGYVAPSGSVCPNGGAIQCVGMQEVATATNVDATVVITNPIINGGVAYGTQAVPAPTYAYAIEAVSRQGRTAKVQVYGSSHMIVAGTLGLAMAGAGCSITQAGLDANGVYETGNLVSQGTPGDTLGRALLVRRNAGAGDWAALCILGGNAGRSSIGFGDRDADADGNIIYDHAAREMGIGAGGSFNQIRIQAGKIAFLGAAPVVRQTVRAAATDAASTQTLANDLRTALINLGLAQ